MTNDKLARIQFATRSNANAGRDLAQTQGAVARNEGHSNEVCEAVAAEYHRFARMPGNPNPPKIQRREVVPDCHYDADGFRVMDVDYAPLND